jgi:predicted AAA+ superfamily ATPase
MDGPLVGQRSQTVRGTETVHHQGLGSGEAPKSKLKVANLIASHLLKLVHFITDYEGYKSELYFLRDVDKREVDFLVTIGGKPWFAVEVKLNDTSLSPHLLYFKERLSIPHVYQVVKKTAVDRIEKGTRLISAGKFLSGLI